MQDFRERTFQFAVSVGKLILDLPYNVVNKEYFSQLVRSSSSIGANYRAAKRAKSDADFINKLKISEEEADEAVYFLELLREFNSSFRERITGLINEGLEILKILFASITTTRTRINKN
ncbi:MAG: four helix bundle protein [Bacteroidota bacterium]|nr:four helix bundle protein [Bacteroidota bacterium]